MGSTPVVPQNGRTVRQISLFWEIAWTGRTLNSCSSAENRIELIFRLESKCRRLRENWGKPPV